MRRNLGAALLVGCGLVLSGTTARAAVMEMSFTGTITSGTAEGYFASAGTDLTGDEVTGTVTWDTAQLASTCNAGGFQCYAASGGYSITETVNDISETFTAASENLLYLYSFGGGATQVYAGAGSNSGYSVISFDNRDGDGQAITNALFTDPSDPSSLFLGTTDLSGTISNGVTFASDGSTFFFDPTSVTSSESSPIPEPASFLLLGPALVGLRFLRHRRRIA